MSDPVGTLEMARGAPSAANRGVHVTNQYGCTHMVCPGWAASSWTSVGARNDEASDLGCLINNVAKLFIDGGVPPGNTPFEAVGGLPLVWLPWWAALKHVSANPGGPNDRDADHKGPRGILLAPGSRGKLESPRRYVSLLRKDRSCTFRPPRQSACSGWRESGFPGSSRCREDSRIARIGSSFHRAGSTRRKRSSSSSGAWRTTSLRGRSCIDLTTSLVDRPHGHRCLACYARSLAPAAGRGAA